MLDGKTLLQVNATIIAGALIFFSLASFFSFEDIFSESTSEELERTAAGYMTLLIVAPFALSSIYIIKNGQATKLHAARVLSRIGFIVLIVVVIIIVVSQLLIPFFFRPYFTIQDTCMANPTFFNVSNNLWMCSKFEDGSAAEICARNPERFNMSISECFKFIPPY